MFYISIKIFCFLMKWLYFQWPSHVYSVTTKFEIWITTGGSRTAGTSKMVRFVIIVNGFQPLTIITKHSILDFAAVLDPPLITCTWTFSMLFKIFRSFFKRKSQSFPFLSTSENGLNLDLYWRYSLRNQTYDQIINLHILKTLSEV